MCVSGEGGGRGGVHFYVVGRYMTKMFVTPQPSPKTPLFFLSALNHNEGT